MHSRWVSSWVGEMLSDSMQDTPISILLQINISATLKMAETEHWDLMSFACAIAMDECNCWFWRGPAALDCDKLDQLPDVKFSIGGTDFKLTASDYALQVRQRSCTPVWLYF